MHMSHGWAVLVLRGLVQVRTATFSTGAQENYAAVANDKRFAVPYVCTACLGSISCAGRGKSCHASCAALCVLGCGKGQQLCSRQTWHMLLAVQCALYDLRQQCLTRTISSFFTTLANMSQAFSCDRRICLAAGSGGQPCHVVRIKLEGRHLTPVKPDPLLPPLAQEYDYHLAAVNTITFVDEGRRFVSTSDDKTIRVWDLGVPVQVRRPARPLMSGSHLLLWQYISHIAWHDLPCDGACCSFQKVSGCLQHFIAQRCHCLRQGLVDSAQPGSLTFLRPPAS